MNKRALYTKLTDNQADKIETLRIKFSDLYDALEELTPSRESSLALTKLEEAQMWANKSISREEI